MCQDGYTLEGTATRVCANGGNWTGENNAVCTGNSLFCFSTSVAVGCSEIMIYSNQ